MYATSYPTLTGDVVTQGHANYCAEHGHATHTVNGATEPFCPRCGVKIDAPVPAPSTPEYVAVDRRGVVFAPGAPLVSFRGDAATLIRVSRIPNGPSTGRVEVRLEDGRTAEYYPSVFDLELVPAPLTRTSVEDGCTVIEYVQDDPQHGIAKGSKFYANPPRKLSPCYCDSVYHRNGC